MEKKNKIRRSYGVIMVRKRKGEELSILMVKKRCTYYFNMFVKADHIRMSDSTLAEMLSHMSLHEKRVIYTLDFDAVWRTYLGIYDSYTHARAITPNYDQYNRNFIIAYCNREGSLRLRKHIKDSRQYNSVWDLPKGALDRHCKKEKPICAAIREFGEETFMQGNIEIYAHIKPIVEEHRFNDTIYINTYYIARATANASKKDYEIADITNMEIDEVRWVSQRTIATLGLEPRHAQRYISLFKRLRAILRQKNSVVSFNIASFMGA